MCIWESLCKSGIESNMDIRFTKKIKITNQISLALAAIATCYIFIFSLAGYLALGLLLIIPIGGLLFCVFLNSLKRYTPSRLLCFAAVAVTVFIYSYLFGNNSSIYLIFIPCACLPWIYFEVKELRYIIALTIISIGCYCFFFFSDGAAHTAVTSAFQRYVSCTIILALFSYLVLCMRFLIFQNNKSEQFLADTYQNFFEDIPTPMWIYDETTSRFIAVNQKAIESYGFSKEEFLSMRITDIIANETINNDGKAIQYKTNNDATDQGYVVHQKKNGTVFYAHVLTNSTDCNGIRARIVQAIDVNDKVVTEKNLEELKIAQGLLKLKEQELLTLVQQKNTINKQLERFTYIVAHEIKSPLNGVVGVLDILMENIHKMEVEEVNDFINELLNTSQHLSKMVDLILDYSRKSEKEINEEDINVNEVVLEVNSLLNLNKKANIRIEGNLPHITTKKLKLQQVFQNLISNAIKYNDKDHCNIVISCDDDKDFYRFCVKDNGPGISDKDQDHIFKLFHTTGNLSGNNESSTGIGLNILKMLVEEQGGRIEVESKASIGSSFYFQWRK